MPPKKVKDFSDRDPYLPHWSSWLVTINSNQTNLEYIAPLRIIFDYIKTHISLFITNILPNAKLLQARSIGNVEIGPNQGKVHLHGQIAIQTTGMSMLNYGAIREFVNKQLSSIPGFAGSYFHADILSNFNASMAVFGYIEKSGELKSEGREDFKIII